MFRLLLLVPTCALVLLGQSLATVLNFEAEQRPGALFGWQGGSPDDKVVHSGRWSARLERTEQSGFSTILKSLPMDFAGKTIVFRGYLKTEDVSDFAGLWVREDGDKPSLAFDNMRTRRLNGTTDWTQYTIILPRVPEAKRLYFGALLSGTGKLWIDDLELLVDGKPVWEAPKQAIENTVLDNDHQFDGGSGIHLGSLSPAQIQNLVTLGKVWGFLKYHHPRVAAGEFHWDYELMRVLPTVLSATDRAAGNAAMAKWIAGLGRIRDCQPCATLDESKVHLRPDNAWIEDKTALGTELSDALRAVHRNRPAGPQFYVSLVSGIGNPDFRHELPYAKMPLPDPGFQLLGLYRFWNIIQYWFPYRDVIGENWDAVLAEFVPRVGLAKDADSFDRELMALAVRAHDAHAFLATSRNVQPPTGQCNVAAEFRISGNRAVVARTFEDGVALKPGDIVNALDGVSIAKLVESIRPYYVSSNEATTRYHIVRSMTRGECGTTATFSILRDGTPVSVSAMRTSKTRALMRHDRPGETFQRLSDDVAYLKLSSVSMNDIPKYIEGAKGSKGLIIDIRNYPSQFVVFALGSRLTDKRVPFARFTLGDLANPGAFHWKEPVSISPASTRFNGKVVVLVDETTISQAEYTALAFRAAGGTVIGSTTQGADGDVSGFPLPGGSSSRISGIGVFYPDKRPTQRVGIVPDIRVEPTIEGMKAGTDEVLERAIEEIVGKSHNPI